MLIDATHDEETRVVIVSGNKLDNFDVEVESKRQLKSNIYLAKVTRVEPSLQAAFVDFGGNRHGFLAFNEIHPDYYQIPIADREALIAEEKSETSDNDDDADTESSDDDYDTQSAAVEDLGGDDADEMEKRRSRATRRHYKIQEVIKRNQILLIQVVKEERGNKGAALTTYISLPGRYCVLMPNTARGGGISRKIANVSDRRHLKTILADLDIPDGVAVIVRTAGSKRTKAEIKRDYDYLMRLWNQVRETTLESIAPALVYEEGNLIKRAIRDLYTKDIEEVIIEGAEGYRVAKDFMKLLIPSHAKRVQPYKETTIPLFHRYQIEGQLDAMHDPNVSLKSGGYIVIGQTEALVAIDVNSGKATRERNIEKTAVNTNLEAADEIARQLRLRDLAGLVVIDFIDMENHRNQHKVERQIREAMRNDRARIQMGRISHFGLLEMSRQRLRPSLMETSSEPCPHCIGTGHMRSTDSAALSVLRAVEEEGMRGRASTITVHVSSAIALYILNQKRKSLEMIEARYEFEVLIEADDSLVAPNNRIDRTVLKHGGTDRTEELTPFVEPASEDSDHPQKKRRRRSRNRKRGQSDNTFESNDNTNNQQSADSGDTGNTGNTGEEGSPSHTPDNTQSDGEEGAPKKRRRGKRGGRRRGKRPEEQTADSDTNTSEVAVVNDDAVSESTENTETSDASAPETDSGEKKNRSPRRRNRSRSSATDTRDTGDTGDTTDNTASDTAVTETSETSETSAQPPAAEPAPAPTPAPEPTTAPVEVKIVEVDPAAAKTTTVVVGGDDTAEKEKEAKPGKKGWWRRSS